MFIVLNKVSKSLYQIHSCDKNLSYQLTENYAGIRRVKLILSLSIKNIFKDITEFIEDYTLNWPDNENDIQLLKEGEAIQYSEEEAHSKIGDRILNYILYHPNVKKIET